MFYSPFHGWMFDKEGKCTYIPYTDKVPEVAKVKKYHVVERNNMIYMYNHAEEDVTEPLWYPHPIDEIESGKYVLHGKFQTFVKCHVQVCCCF